MGQIPWSGTDAPVGLLWSATANAKLKSERCLTMLEDAPTNTAQESAWKRLIFWDFPRGSWQYDVVVVLILLFIFAVPRELFRDQPRAASVVFLSSEKGYDRAFIEADLLNGLDDAARLQRSQDLINQKTGKSHQVVRVEPIRDDAELEIKGYIAYTVH
jgi:hypothetical protein